MKNHRNLFLWATILNLKRTEYFDPIISKILIRRDVIFYEKSARSDDHKKEIHGEIHGIQLKKIKI